MKIIDNYNQNKIYKNKIFKESKNNKQSKVNEVDISKIKNGKKNFNNREIKKANIINNAYLTDANMDFIRMENQKITVLQSNDLDLNIKYPKNVFNSPSNIFKKTA